MSIQTQLIFIAKVLTGDVQDVVNRIEKRVHNKEQALDMIERVEAFAKSHNPSDDLTQQEVRNLYPKDDLGDEFETRDEKLVDIGWTSHAEYRQELRDVDSGKVNSEIVNLVERHPKMHQHEKTKLVKPFGQAVVDLDTNKFPVEADVITVIK